MKNLFYGLCYYIGIIPFFYWLNRQSQIVLNYHHVLPAEIMENNIIYGYSHSTESFERQLDIISSRFTVDSEFGQAGTAVITFDDGAVNNFKYAFPLLAERDMRAFFFLIHDQLDSRELSWIDKWFLWIGKVPEGIYRLGDITITIGNDSDRLKIHQMLWEYLNQHYEKKDQLLEAMENAYSFKNLSKYLHSHSARFFSLGYPEISVMKESGHFFGYHSKNHDILNRINSLDLKSQLNTVKQGGPYNTNAFAIPFGTEMEFSERVLEIIEQAGFSPILLNQPENPTGKSTVIGRRNLPDTSGKFEIHAHLSGFYDFIKRRG